MPVNDRGDLRDHLAGVEAHEHVVAGLRQIGGEARRVDRLVKNSFRHPIEDGLVAGFDSSDLKLHRRHLHAITKGIDPCRSSSISTRSPPSARRR
jgi:hypothetical protein